MNKFQIRDIEALTGIKSHTLRVWEQRYNLCCPKRTETNIRYYEEGDLKLLLNIATLNDFGLKISEIAKLNPEEINDKVLELADNCEHFGCQIQNLSTSMLNLDEFSFDKILNTNILKLGFEKTMVNIVFPFLNRMGIMWQTSNINPAHEHFATHLIKQKLIVAIDNQVMPRAQSGKKFLLFLPEGESHEIGLLFANFLIKSKGHHVLYLGPNLPCAHLCEVAKSYNPDCVFSLLTANKTGEELENFAGNLCNKLKESTVFLSGQAFAGVETLSPANLKILKNIPEFIDILEKADY